MRLPRTTHIFPGCCRHLSTARRESTPSSARNSVQALLIVSADRKGLVGRRMLKQSHLVALLAEAPQSEFHPLDVGGKLASQLARSKEGHGGSIVASDLRVGRRVRRNHHVREDPALQSGRDGVRDHRMPCQDPHVLPRDALGAGPRRDQTDHPGCRLPSCQGFDSYTAPRSTSRQTFFRAL